MKLFIAIVVFCLVLAVTSANDETDATQSTDSPTDSTVVATSTVENDPNANQGI